MQIFFPHKETRETQDSFIKDIISSIKDKKNIIAHVPTGIGKTAAILSTTISLALKKNLTIFFLTPRHTQHKIAIETLSLIKNKFNLDFNVTDFIGKRHMCIVPNISTSSQSQFYEYCKDVREKQTCEFYMNLKKEKTRLKLFLKELNILNVEDLISKSKKERFCPFEVSCELAKKSNVIIADYYHILSPKIRDNLLKRINKNLSSSIIIFDEAHNLPQKSRELLTSTLSTYSLELAFKESKQFKLDLPELEDIKNILLNLSKKVPFEKKESLVNKQDFDFENYTEFLLNLKLI
ncbi:MAG: DEAD/DEAH box helicase family protein, partial [Nanoarchaeota archaeon]|nr:DEAD/DEAH box helicase family protein [Nanoarchaeota archaeon]